MIVLKEETEIVEVKRIKLPNGKVIRLYSMSVETLKNLKIFSKGGE